MVKKAIEIPPDRRGAPGYSLDGVSQHSHQAAQGRTVDMRTRDRMSWSRLDMLIENERKQVAKLERRAVAARGTGQHYIALCSKLQKTRYFLRRLEADQRERAAP